MEEMASQLVSSFGGFLVGALVGAAWTRAKVRGWFE